MGDLARNFSMGEFGCRDGTAVPKKYEENARRVAQNLQVLRDELNRTRPPGTPERTIEINSGYRTDHYHLGVLKNTTRDSQHLRANAADIHVPGVSAEEVHNTIQRLIDAGRMSEGGLHVYPKGFVHYDPRGTKARW